MALGFLRLLRRFKFCAPASPSKSRSPPPRWGRPAWGTAEESQEAPAAQVEEGRVRETRRRWRTSGAPAAVRRPPAAGRSPPEVSAEWEASLWSLRLAVPWFPRPLGGRPGRLTQEGVRRRLRYGGERGGLRAVRPFPPRSFTRCGGHFRKWGPRLWAAGGRCGPLGWPTCRSLGRYPRWAQVKCSVIPVPGMQH